MDYSALRRRMVESQLRTNKITDDAVLDAMGEVPRELFVPRALKSVAYLDEDLQIAPGRYLMEPMVLGRLLHLAEVKASDQALVIGCGNGYSAAVLARFANSVVAVESDAALAQRAQELLAELGATNVSLVRGPLTAGHPAKAPYDVILIDGAVQEIPDPIAAQLSVGGRLVAVLQADGPGRAILATRAEAGLSQRVVFDCSVPPLPGFAKAPSFVF
ncbi:protein-L-isoaspartate O-methyltransferase family protein [Hypericibacter sp.]|uniref:protein-L-isoaspartate O-methyltransferase family protein n=1 Tax=Hypericibacter sp. TaxID=2705401 RepID=UPI003D6CC5DF